MLALSGAFAAPGFAQTQVTNTANITLPSGVVDTNTTNNSSSVTVNVVAPLLTLTKTASVGTGSFTVGVAASYTLSVQNTGTTATTAVATITDTIPTGLTIGTLPAGCSAAGQVVTCNVAAGLAAGGSTSFVIPVTPTVAAAASVTNTATVSGGGDSTCPANTRCTSTVTNAVNRPQLTLSKTASASSFTVGVAASYTLQVSNTGTSATTAVSTITDTIPTGLTIGTLPAGCSATGQAVTCNVAAGLAAGGSTSFVIPVTPQPSINGTSVTNTATVSGGGDSTCPAASRCSSTAGPTPVAAPQLTMTKTSSTPAFTVGTAASYTLSVQNTGTTATTAVATITDTIPTGLTIGTLPAGCSAAGQVVTCNVAAGLAAGGSTSFVIPVTPTVAAAASVTNTATVSGGGDSTCPANTRCTSTVTNAVNRPQLTLSKTASASSFTVGVAASYTLQVSNTGTSATTAVSTITDTIPTGLTIGTLPAGCSATGQAVTCNVAAGLAAGGSTSFVIPVTPQPSINGTSVTNTATVSGGGDSTCPAASRCSSTAGPTPVAAPQLTMTKTSSTPAFTVGTAASYTLSVQNTGTTATTAVATITDTIPTGLTIGTLPAGCSAAGQVVTCNVAAGLAAGGSTSFVIPVTPTVAAAASVTNTATVSGGGDSTCPANTRCTSTVTNAVNRPLINMAKTAGSVSAPDSSGNYTVTYTVTATNSGGAAGVYGVMSDRPIFSSNLVIVGASWTTSGTGVPAGGSEAGDGPYVLAPANTALGAGVTHTYNVSITFNFATNSIATACSGNPGGGLYNAVDWAGGNEANTGDNAACVSAPLPPPQLTLTKTASAAGFTVGVAGSYTLAVQNTGLTATTAVSTITDTIPTGLTIGTLPAGCSATGQAVTCTVATGLAASASTSFVIPVTPQASINGTSVTNTATVSGGGDSTCPAASRCTSTVGPTPVAAPQLTLTKTSSTPAFTVGTAASYTLSVQNTGTTATTAASTITDTIPTGLTIGTLPAGCSAAGQVVTCTVAAGLAVNATSSFVIPVTPQNSTHGTTLVNTASVSGGGDAGCPATARCTSSVSTSVQALSVAIGDAATVNEGGNLVYTVTLSGGTATQDIVIPVTYNGTATNGVDYTNIGTVTIPAGQATGTLTVPTLIDTIVEGDETVVANLGTPSLAGVTVTDGSGVGTITDVAPTLTVNISGTPTINEGGNLVFPVTMTGGTSTTATTVTVTYTGTATNGVDYTNVATVVIPAGATTADLTVPTLTDTIVEGDETVIPAIAAGTGYTVGTSTATGTITDVAPTLTVNISGTPTINEGGNLVFPVTMTGGTSTTATTVTVTYTGTATNGVDYTNVATVVIPAGATTADLTVPTLTDTIVEGDETVIPAIAAGTGYTVGTSTATGTITDVAPTLTVNISGTPTINEGGNLVFPVTMTGGTSTTATTVTVTYTGTATNGVDYTNVATVVIPAGATTADLTVPTLTDTIVEGDETVIPAIAAGTGYTVGTSTATGTITDVAPTLTVNISGTPTINEGGNLVFPVTMTGGTSTTATTVTVTYTGTATNGVDYTNVATVVIPAGATTADLTVPTLTDTIVEGDETVIPAIAAGTGYTVGTSTATGTITDVAPTLTVNISGTPTINEGGNLVFPVTMTGGTSTTATTVTVTYTGTATNGVDYTNVATVVIPAGATTADLTVPTLTDTIVEGDETVIPAIAAGTGYTVGTSTATGTITDVAPTLTVNISGTPTINEGGNLVFPVTMTGGTSTTATTVTVTYTGTATNGVDYTNVATVVIPAGATTADLTVPTLTDTIVEGDETVIPAIAAGTGYTVGTSTATGTITDVAPTLTVNISGTPTINEGGNLVFPVTMTGGTSTTATTVTVTYTGTATNGVDYTNVATVVIPAGATTADLTVPTLTDTIVEGDETVIPAIAAGTGYTVGTSTATGTITDVAPTLTVNISGTPTINEGGNLVFPVTMTGGTSTTATTVTVTYTGTATNGVDYTNVATVVIPAGATTADLTVPTLTDTIVEGDETVIPAIAAGTGYTVGTSTATGTITDVAPTLTVNISGTPTINEGGNLVFPVTMTGGTSTTATTVTVTYTGTATNGVDYTNVATVVIPAGATTADLTVPTLTDTIVEGDETVIPAIAAGTGYTVGTSTATGTITDVAPTLTVNISGTPTINEGGNLVFPVTMTGGTSTTATTVTVTYTGTATNGVDYTNVATVVIPAGATTADLTVPTLTDTIVEGDETVIPAIAAGTGYTVGTSTATGTITDVAPTLTVNISGTPTINEGGNLVFPVTMTGGTSTTATTVTVTYTGTATNGVDYTNVATVVIPAGATTADLTVPTLTDTIVEGDETVIPAIAAGTGYTVGTSTATGTITDVAPTLTVNISGTPTINEGGNLVFPVTMTGGTSTTATTVTVTYTGTATNGVDYTNVATVVIPAGATTADLTVPTLTDTIVEGDETVIPAIAAGTGYTVGTSTATGTITDVAPTLTVNISGTPTINEGGNLVFPVTMTGGTSTTATTVTVTYTGTATNGVDYTNVATVVIPAGATTADLTVPTLTDTIVEGDETVIPAIAAGTGYTVGTSTATGTITDVAPTLTVNISGTPTINEGGNLVFPVTMTGGTSTTATTVTVTYTGTATNGVDYTNVATVVIPAGATTADLTVPTLTDTIVEGDETVIPAIAAGTGYTVGTSTATGTITDVAPTLTVNISGTPTINEGGNLVFPVTMTGGTSTTATTVTVTYTGTATNGVDYTNVATVVIPAGATTADLTVPTLTDTIVEGDETVIPAIAAGTGYTVGTSTATGTITDVAPTLTVNISGTPTINEGGNLVFPVTMTGGTSTTATTVTVTYTGTATNGVDYTNVATVVIPAGATTADLTVPTLTDTIVEGDETVIPAIAAGTGYTVGTSTATGTITDVAPTLTVNISGTPTINEGGNLVFPVTMTGGTSTTATTVTVTYTGTATNGVDYTNVATVVIPAGATTADLTVPTLTDTIVEGDETVIPAIAAGTGYTVGTSTATGTITDVAPTLTVNISGTPTINEGGNLVFPVTMTGGTSTTATTVTVTYTGTATNGVDYTNVATVVIPAGATTADLTVPTLTDTIVEGDETVIPAIAAGTGYTVGTSTATGTITDVAPTLTVNISGTPTINEGGNLVFPVTMTGGTSTTATTVTVTYTGTATNGVDYTNVATVVIPAGATTADLTVPTLTDTIVEGDETVIPAIAAGTGYTVGTSTATGTITDVAPTLTVNISGTPTINEGGNLVFPVTMTGGTSTTATTVTVTYTGTATNGVDYTNVATVVIPAGATTADLTVPTLTDTIVEGDETVIPAIAAGTGYTVGTSTATGTITDVAPTLTVNISGTPTINEGGNLVFPVTMTGGTSTTATTVTVTYTGTATNGVDYTNVATVVIPAGATTADLTVPTLTDTIVEGDETVIPAIAAGTGYTVGTSTATGTITDVAPTLTVNISGTPTINEGGNLVFPVTMTGGTSTTATTVTVTYTGTATNGVDYTNVATVVIPAGATTADLTVPTLTDTIVEGDETVIPAIAAGTGYTVGTSTATGTITDVAPTLTVNISGTPTINEGGNLVFPVTMTGGTSTTATTVTVTYTGTATNGVDYTNVATVVIPAGATTADLTVPTLTDTIVEGDETVIPAIAAGTGYTVGTSTATGTITDVAPTLTVNISGTPTINEGGNLVFPVTMTGGTSTTATTVTVTYTGTATNGVDYTNVATVVIPAGATTADLTVPTLTDTIVEGDETVIPAIAAGTGYTVGTSTATGTITDVAPTLTVNISGTPTINEGGNLVFPVTMTGGTSTTATTVTVTYTGTATNGVDYTNVATVVIPAGATTADLTVPTLTDTIVEGDETVIPAIAAGTGYTVGTSTATGTITDVAPTLTVNISGTPTINEGGNLVFPVTMTGGTSTTATTVTVTYTGTATNGVDYTNVATVVIPAGATTADLTVPTLTDTIVEGDETVIPAIAAGTGYTVGTSTATGTITDVAPTLTVNISGTPTINEGGNLVFPVTMTGGTSTTATTVTVTYTGTATNGVDYTNVATVVIPAGATTADLTVPTLTDTIVEGDETVIPAIAAGTGYTVGTSTATGTITDVAPTLTVNISGTPTINEGGNLVFPVTMTGGTSTTATTVTVTYTGTATNGVDYTNVATVVIPAGATTADLTVPTLTDTIVEGDETVIPAIAAGTGYTVGTSTATGTITDVAPTLTVNISGTPTINEGGNLVFPVTMTGGTSTTATTVTVTYTGTATNGVDYTNVATVVIPAGATTADLTVPTLTDTIVEGDETVIPAIAAGTGYTVGTSTATGTITDVAPTLTVNISGTPTINEGGNLVFPVTMTGGTSTTATTVTVTYTGTATNGVDYTNVATVVIPAGATTADLTVPTLTDTIVEGDETVIPAIAAGTGYTVGTSTATGTITDVAPTLTVNISGTPTINEGGNLVFPVTMTGGTSTTATTVTVTYTGTATNGVDYTNVATVVIPAGATTADLTVPTLTDTIVEGDETVIPAIAAGTGYTVGTSTATGTITDVAPTLTVNISGTPTINEGGNLVFPVTMTGGTSTTATTVTVTYTGTATNGVDYTNVATVVIPAGATTADLTVPTLTDTIVEGDETVIPAIAAGTGYTVGTSTATGTITDVAPTLTVNISGTPTINEGGNLVFPVTMTGGTSTTATTVTVTYTGTATNGVDYTNVATVVIPAGATTADLTVPTLTDTIVEGDETVIPAIAAGTGYTVGTSTATGTITDVAPTLTVNISGTPTINEGGNLVFPVTMTGGTSTTATTVTVTYTGTATNGVDYTNVATVVIPAGATTADLTVPTLTDTIVEGDETVIPAIAAGTGYTVGTSTATGTITDVAPTLTVNISGTPTINEGGNLVFPVTMTGGTSTTATTVTVTYTGTATNGVDYTNVATVVIPAGATTADLTVPTLTDTIVEGDETVIPAIAAGTGYTVGTSTATGTITDVAPTLTVNISGTPTINEGGNLVFPVTMTGGTSTTATTVTVTYTGTATNGVDYTNVATVVIPAGATTADLTVPTLTDTIVEGDETVIPAIAAGTGYTVGTSTATGTITDVAPTLTVNISGTPTINEGGNLVFPVTMTGGTSTTATTVTVTYTGTATNGVDYTNVATVVIPAGATTADLTVPTLTDTIVEGDETVIPAIAAGTGYTVGTSTATGTITDVAPTLTVNISGTPTINEGGNLVFPVTMTGGTSTTATTVTVTYTGTATNGVDYTNVATVVIPAGATTADLTVPTLTDTIVEGDETVIPAIAAGTGYTVGTSTATGTITDVAPTLTVNISGTPTINEGGNLVFPVTMTGGTSTTATTVTVTYTGTATNGVDYTNVATVVIPAGATTADLTVPTLTDTIVEGDETVIPAIAAGTGYTVGTSTATGTITDVAPTLTVNISGTPTINEGGNLVFPVTMTGGTSTTATTVTVTYTGTATNGVDYTNVATVVIPAGATTADLTVPTLTDTIVEGDETVIPAIAAGTGYTVGTSTATGTITDVAPTLTVNISGTPTINEGGNLVFPVTMTGGTSTTATTVTVTYTGTATNGVDYTNVATVVIPAGATTADLTVPTLTDTIVEGDETVIPAIAAGTGYTVGTSTATGTITDVAPTLTVNISGTPTINEGGNLVFPVTMTGGTSTTATTVTVTYTGTATNGVDYTNVATVVIPAGATTADLTVPTLTDTIVEGDETVIPAIAAGTGYTVGTSTATGTITDVAPTLTVNISGTPTINEGGNLVFPVTMTGGTSTTATTVTVTYTGTATNGVDYTNVATVVIPAGATTADLTVPTLTDTIVEGDETVIPAIAAGTGYTVGTSTATGTITDVAPTLTVNISGTPTINEGGNLVFPVTMTGGTSTTATTVTVTYTGTATNGVDYTNVATVVIPAGATTADLTVPTLTDTIVEGDETVIPAIAAGTGYTVGTSTATGTITDVAPTLTVNISGTPTINEGGNLVFPVTMTGGTSTTATTVTVTYTGTATNGVDYTNVATVVIPAGATTADLTVPTLTDTIVEGDETVIPAIAAGTGYTVGTSTATGTITDVAPTLTVNISGTPTINEGGNLVFPVTMTGGTSTTATTVTVTYTGTATNGVDYTNVATVVIPAGATTADLTVPTLTDTIVEGDETVIPAIAAGTGYTVGTSTATGTIIDSTPAQSLVKAITANADGDASGTVSAGDVLTYTVTLTNTGSTTLSNVTVNDAMIAPSSVACASVAPGSICQLVGTYTVTAADASAGVVRNTATSTSPACPAGSTDPTCTTTIDTPVVSPQVTYNKSVILPVGQTEVSVGDTLTYTLQVQVTSAGTTAPVTLTDTLGTGLTLANVTAGAFSCGNGNPLVCTLPSGTAPGTYVVTYTAIVNDLASGFVRNTVVASGDDAPTCQGACQTATIVTEPLPAIISYGKTAVLPAGRTQVVAGDVITYTLSTTVAAAPTSGVLTLTDTLGTGLTFGAVTSAGAYTCTGTQPLVCTLPSGTTPGVYEVSYTATVNAQASGVVRNGVVGSSDDNPVCATDCDVETPVASPTILVNKSANPANGTAVQPGQVITYVLSVQVGQAATRAAVTLVDTPGQGLTLGATPAGCAYNGTTMTCTLPAGTAVGTHTFTYTATVAASANGRVSNVVVASNGDPSGDPPTCQSCSTEHQVNLPEIRLSKTAGAREVKVGDLVRYTLTVENVGSSDLVNGRITDTPPAGFSYVEGSLVAGDADQMATVSGTQPIRIEGVDVRAGETATLVYVMRVGAGVRPGTHVNQAQARSITDEPVSNVATAEVTLTADALIDDSLLMGTVFNDRDGDGWQDSAALSGVKVQGGFAPGAYIANSTTVDRGAGPQPEPDASSPMLHGIAVGRIAGRQSVAEPVDAHEVVIRQRLSDVSFTDDFVLTSDQGVTVRMDAAGNTRVEQSGDAAKGLNAATPTVERRVSQGEGGYVVDYVIRNAGIDERGIPGVRIASVEGLLIETDQYGRYHLAGVSGGAWERGRNFILKVDPSTLPAGAEFTTDNPLLRRITPGVPVRFDFGVKLPEQVIEGGLEQVELELGDVFFAPGSAEVRESYLPVIDAMAAQVRKHQGGEVVINANGDSEGLAFQRAEAVKHALLAQLDGPAAKALVVSARTRVDDPGSLVVGVDEGGALLGTVLFDTDKAAIRPEFEALLDTMAASLEKRGGGSIAIVGHTDLRGSHAYNTALGMRRAKAVYEAIAKRLSPEVRAKVRVEASNDPAAPAGARK